MEKTQQESRYHLFLGWSLFLITSIPTMVLAFQPEAAILKWFHNDDAYYYFVTARNIGSGLGSTFDGIAPTNGYHPLWMLICIPIFTLLKSDLIMPLRAVILVQALLNGGTALAFFSLLRKLIPTETAFFAGLFWAAAPAVFSQIAVGGLETGLNAFLLTLMLFTMYWSLELNAPPGKRGQRILVFGIITALAVLARLDNAFPAAFAGLWLIVRRWKTDEDMYDLPWSRRFSEYLAYGLPAVVLVGGYLLFNYFTFGDFMPVGGQVKHWWGTLPGYPGHAPETLRELYVTTFASKDRSLVPWAPVYIASLDVIEKSNEWLASLGLPAVMRTRWLLLVLAALLLLDFRNMRKAVVQSGMIPLLLGAFGQILYYKLSGHAAPRPWYWVMELLFSVLFLALLMGVLGNLLRRVPKGAVPSSLLFLALSAFLFWQHIQYIHALAQPPSTAVRSAPDTAAWLETNTEEGALIGLTGSGSMGYFVSGRTIVNLDGLISSYDYLHHLQSGTGANYLEEIGLDYVMGTPDRILEVEPYKGIFPGRVELRALRDENDPEGNSLWVFIP